MESIGRAVERLLMDESLTADVDDAAAKVLLRWGEEQLKAGRPAQQVQPTIKTLAHLIGKRARLDLSTARARLEQAGLAADDVVLSGLWVEALPEGEWAEKLISALTVAVSPAPPLPVPPPPPISAATANAIKETRDQGASKTWWRRLFSRREPT